MNYKYVVYQVEWGGDVDGTGPERWRGMELARFDTEDAAWAFVDNCNDYCEIEMEFKMNIHTVAQNLRNTIAGKEYMLQELQGMKFNDIAKNLANDTTIKFLEVNIDELKRVLQDVEVCIADEIDANKFTGV